MASHRPNKVVVNGVLRSRGCGCEDCAQPSSHCQAGRQYGPATGSGQFSTAQPSPWVHGGGRPTQFVDASGHSSGAGVGQGYPHGGHGLGGGRFVGNVCVNYPGNGSAECQQSGPTFRMQV